MGYQARIHSTSLERGMLRVVVEYSIPETDVLFTDAITTVCGQSNDWINEQIKKKIADLDAVLTLKDTIVVDTVVTTDPVVGEPVEVTAKDQYRIDKDNYQKMISAVSQGIMEKTDPALVALRQKLKDDFSTDYIDLF